MLKKSRQKLPIQFPRESTGRLVGFQRERRNFHAARSTDVSYYG